jgi:hypothetical protein
MKSYALACSPRRSHYLLLFNFHCFLIFEGIKLKLLVGGEVLQEASHQLAVMSLRNRDFTELGVYAGAKDLGVIVDS